jgi:hypothetical protein
MDQPRHFVPAYHLEFLLHPARINSGVWIVFAMGNSLLWALAIYRGLRRLLPLAGVYNYALPGRQEGQSPMSPDLL